jgi:hypothetical protein
MSLKLIKGSTVEEQMQSIDMILDSLHTRRYSLAVDAIPAPVISNIPLSVVVVAGKVGIKALPLGGKIINVSWANPALTKDNAISVTIMHVQQTTINRLKLTKSSSMIDTDIPVLDGSDINIEILPPLDVDICIGLMLKPSKAGA